MKPDKKASSTNGFAKDGRPRTVGDLNYVWEWNTPDEMQMQLAGFQPREEYLRERLEKVALVSRQLKLTTDAELFEVGSGEGVMAAALAPQVRSILCTDVSRSFLDKARSTCQERDNVSFHHIRNDFLADLPTASFDGGFSFQVFIHLNVFEIYLYLCEIQRILRPGGRFCFNFLDFGEATRNFFHYYASRYREANPFEFKGFLSWHGAELVTRIATEAGLTPLRDEVIDEGGVVYLTVLRGAEAM